MDLKLEEKFTKDEISELKKRVFTFTREMFMEGLSLGREIGKNEFHDKAEGFAYKKINDLSHNLINDEIWKHHPPYGYDAFIGIEYFNDGSKDFEFPKTNNPEN